MTIFMMLFIEMMAAKFDVFGGEHEHGMVTATPSREDLEKSGMFDLLSSSKLYFSFLHNQEYACRSSQLLPRSLKISKNEV